MTAIKYSETSQLLQLIVERVNRASDMDDQPIMSLNQALTEQQALRNILQEQWRPFSPELVQSLCQAVTKIIRRFGPLTPMAETVSPNPVSLAVDEILLFMTSYPELPAEGAKDMFQAYISRLAASVGKNGHPHPNLKGELAWKRMTTMMTMMGNSNMPVSLLGSAWRLGVAVDFPSRLNMFLVGNPATPPAVSARLIVDDHTLTDAMAGLHDRWMRNVTAVHPDLDGLPFNLLAEALSTQAVPADWYIDLFPTEVAFFQLAPWERRG